MTVAIFRMPHSLADAGSELPESTAAYWGDVRPALPVSPRRDFAGASYAGSGRAESRPLEV